ncbi:hypothetical protein CDAR_468531 [Caerostris darwini]|uniref:Protein kinase domain-containing protein n=1 Tax=Caerostris darwini TaxID=1538125 RepID=A0AAV4Q4I8_9ARAC|nr:hypothetical protein CDAR_468531 [Caerostris darwini]
MHNHMGVLMSPSYPVNHLFEQEIYEAMAREIILLVAAGFRYIHSEIRLSHLGPRVHINRDETAEVLGTKISPQHGSTMQIKLRKATNASLNRVYFFLCHHVTSTPMICIESSFQTSVLLSRTAMPLQRQKQRFQKLFE